MKGNTQFPQLPLEGGAVEEGEGEELGAGLGAGVGAGEAVTGGLLVDPATGGSSGGGQVSRSLICFLSQLVKWETSA